MVGVMESEATSKFMSSMGNLASKSVVAERDLEQELKILGELLEAGQEFAKIFQGHLDRLSDLGSEELAQVLSHGPVNLEPLVTSFSVLKVLPVVKESPLNFMEIANLELSFRGLDLRQIELENRLNESFEEEATTLAWQNSDLSSLSEFEPYDWGDVDPDTVGEPIS